MFEKPKEIPRSYIKNQELAWDMAHAEAPLKNIAREKMTSPEDRIVLDQLAEKRSEAVFRESQPAETYCESLFAPLKKDCQDDPQTLVVLKELQSRLLKLSNGQDWLDQIDEAAAEKYASENSEEISTQNTLYRNKSEIAGIQERIASLKKKRSELVQEMEKELGIPMEQITVPYFLKTEKLMEDLPALMENLSFSAEECVRLNLEKLLEHLKKKNNLGILETSYEVTGRSRLAETVDGHVVTFPGESTSIRESIDQTDAPRVFKTYLNYLRTQPDGQDAAENMRQNLEQAEAVKSLVEIGNEIRETVAWHKKAGSDPKLLLEGQPPYSDQEIRRLLAELSKNKFMMALKSVLPTETATLISGGIIKAYVEFAHLWNTEIVPSNQDEFGVFMEKFESQIKPIEDIKDQLNQERWLVYDLSFQCQPKM